MSASSHNSGHRGWLRYLTAVGAGGAAVALSVTWFSGPLAAGIGAAVTTVYTLVTEQVRPQRREPHQTALLRTVGGRVPRVRQLNRPESAGVHPADGHPDHQLAPPYVERDAHRDLARALRDNSFVLIVGESTAGKTRIAYEVALLTLPQYAFVRPLTRRALPHAIKVARRRRRAILWLDDLENYLGAEGLTASELAGLMGGSFGCVVVLATMRSEEFRRYEAREESRLTGSDRDAWRVQREVLHLATKVQLNRRWSAEEQHRAHAYPDPRIQLALRSCDRFGLAEVLAAGPELLASWRNAWAPGANPRGAAIVAAAVDCRRSGLRRPVTRQWLYDLHLPYLAERGGPDLQPEPFSEAMQWACKAAYATSGLLIGNFSQGYIAFDYLLSTPGLPRVPDHLWEELLSRVGAADAYDMGILAHQSNQLARATKALEHAYVGGIDRAEYPLAIAVGERGRPREAVQRLEVILRSRRAQLGSRHPDTLACVHQWAFFTGEAGEAQTAAEEFRDLIATTTAALGSAHADTLAARHQCAYFTGEAGGVTSAVEQLVDLLDFRQRLEGSRSPQVLAVRRSLIWFSAMTQGLATAERELKKLALCAREELKPGDPHLLAILSTQAEFHVRAGRTQDGIEAFTEIFAERSRILGRDHPHSLHTRLQLAQALMRLGRTDHAQRELMQIMIDAEAVLEPGHRHLVLAESLIRHIQGT